MRRLGCWDLLKAGGAQAPRRPHALGPSELGFWTSKYTQTTTRAGSTRLQETLGPLSGYPPIHTHTHKRKRARFVCWGYHLLASSHLKKKKKKLLEF